MKSFIKIAPGQKALLKKERKKERKQNKKKKNRQQWDSKPIEF